MEPELAIQRRILEAKRDQYRAQGYEWAINAELARRLDEGEQVVRKAEQNSRQAYRAAKETQALLDALPEPEA